MCGIAGFTHRQRPVDSHLIQRIAKGLIHRGPDQQGVYESAGVSLAAVRLKIIDLAGGDQPVFTEDRDCVVVFNGEIYNHAELRRDLESRGHRFRSACDTEVVLRGFVEWDVGVFRRLRGMFAAALWRESDRRLILARDRLGIKPLYLHRRDGQVYFGSELKAILEHPEIPRRLDLTGLDYYLALNYAPCPHTLADGIEKLPPGHWLEWRDGKIRVEPYWRLEFRPTPRPLAAAVEELDGLLKSSVREHLVSDVPLGLWSSGGIDSSTILHYAAEASATPLMTFSVSFAGRSFDESPWFREIAKQYGTDHHEFDLNPDAELADAIEEFAYYSDEPSADAGALPVWHLSRMTRRHVTVALAGDGGDELFGGYLTYRADAIARRLRWIPAAGRRAALAAARALLPVSDDKIAFEYKVKRMLEGSLLSADDAHFFWNGTGSPDQRRALLPAAGGRSLETLIPNGVRGINRYILTDHHYYLPDDILCKVDRMSMAHSLEVRPPFLDHRIVEFAASLPEEFKIRGSRQKVVLKALMRGKLPESILTRSKTGFDIPAHDWFRGALRPLLLDTLSEQAVKATGVFSWQALRALIDDHLERRLNVGYHLWGLVTLFLWMKRWNIGTPPSSSSWPDSFSSDVSLARHP